MENCAKCGKELTLKGEGELGYTIAGIQIGAAWDDTNPEAAAHVRANLGKYAPADERVKSVTFKFCLECSIDSLMFSDPFPRKYVDVTAVGDERPKYLILPGVTEEFLDVARKVVEAAEQEKDAKEGP